MLRPKFFVLLALLILPSIAAAQTIDVYIVAGQSNADGRGDVSDLSEAQLANLENDTIISYVNPGSERERAVPTSTPPDLDVGTNGFTPLVPGGFSVDGTSARQLTPTFGPELSFGALIAEATGSNNQIAIIKVSRGGASLRNDWRVNPTVDPGPDTPEGFLYRALLEEVPARLAELEADGSTAIVRGVVWHQGESDSVNGVDEYVERYIEFVESVRDEFGEDILFAVGELSRNRVDPDGSDRSILFNTNLAQLAADSADPNNLDVPSGIFLVSSLGLETPRSLDPTNFDTDGTHFTAIGQIELGERYVAAFKTVPLNESVMFDFRNEGSGVLGADPAGTNFAPSVAGDTITVGGLTLEIVDVTAPEYDTTGDLPVSTGNILSSAAGDAVNTNVSGQNALGINNSSINNGNFDLIGNGSESSDLNPGETVTFTFDQPVQFTSIELESVIDVDSFDVLVDGVAVLETIGDDSFIDLGGLADITIAAGSEITFAVDGVLETATMGPATSVRIESFTVEIVTAAPPILGDVNLDNSVNFLDIAPFISILANGLFQAEADINGSGGVDFLDISPFIQLLTTS